MNLISKTLDFFGLGKTVRIGAFNAQHPKSCVSGWHYRAFGDILGLDDTQGHESVAVDDGCRVLAECCDDKTTLITGAPLKNLGAALRGMEDGTLPSFSIGKWVCQGGFAGVGVVPENLIMKKFAGKTHCHTFNLGGDIRSASLAIASQSIKKKFFVSKNVCHRVKYTKHVHTLLMENLLKQHILVMVAPAVQQETRGHHERDQQDQDDDCNDGEAESHKTEVDEACQDGEPKQKKEQLEGKGHDSPAQAALFSTSPPPMQERRQRGLW